MADIALSPRSAFGDAPAGFAAPGCRLSEGPARGLFHVALVADPAGLPGPGRWTEERPLMLIALAPGQWLAAGPETGLEAALAARLPGAALTDLSDGLAPLRLEGARARGALARLTALDFEDAAFPVGAAARTAMMQMAATILRLPDGPDGPVFALEVARSSARSFVHHVREAMESAAARG